MFLNSQMSISAYEVQCRSGPTFHQNRVGTFSQKCQLNCSHTVSLLKDLMNIQKLEPEMHLHFFIWPILDWSKAKIGFTDSSTGSYAFTSSI